MSGATYGGNGLRASATFTPADGSSVTQNYLWAGDTLLMDSGNAYIYGKSITPAEQVNLTTGTVTYLVADSLGSVRGTVNSSGTLTGTTSYDAWGNPQTSGGLTAATPFGFAGGYTDPDGLIYLVNRYYDPATGQFMSVDPDLAQTQQPYQYTGDNPVNETDPTGDSTVTENTYYLTNCHVPSCGPNGCVEPDGSVSYQSPDDISGTGCNLVASEEQDAITLDLLADSPSTAADALDLYALDPAGCNDNFADCIDPAELPESTTGGITPMDEIKGPDGCMGPTADAVLACLATAESHQVSGGAKRTLLTIGNCLLAGTGSTSCTAFIINAQNRFNAINNCVNEGEKCPQFKVDNEELNEIYAEEVYIPNGPDVTPPDWGDAGELAYDILTQGVDESFGSTAADILVDVLALIFA